MKLSNEEILKIAMYQSSIDANCNVKDFSRTENVIVFSKENIYNFTVIYKIHHN